MKAVLLATLAIVIGLSSASSLSATLEDRPGGCPKGPPCPKGAHVTAASAKAESAAEEKKEEAAAKHAKKAKKAKKADAAAK